MSVPRSKNLSRYGDKVQSHMEGSTILASRLHDGHERD